MYGINKETIYEYLNEIAATKSDSSWYDKPTWDSILATTKTSKEEEEK